MNRMKVNTIGKRLTFGGKEFGKIDKENLQNVHQCRLRRHAGCQGIELGILTDDEEGEKLIEQLGPVIGYWHDGSLDEK